MAIVNVLTVVEIDLWDGAETQVLRLANVGFVGGDDARYLYHPEIDQPVQIGVRISGEQYGEAIRGQSNGGLIVFNLNEDLWEYLDYHWIGREFRVYAGDLSDSYEDLSLVYRGVVDDLSHDTMKATVNTTTTAIELNTAFAKLLYDEAVDTTINESLNGKPKPIVIGTCYNIAPPLIDEATITYQLTIPDYPLAEVMQVRVGGTVWDYTSSTSPVRGQWHVDLTTGILILGAVALNGDVRADVRGVDYASINAAVLIRTLVESAGGTVNDDSMTQFATDAGYQVGYYTGTEPINIDDMLDDITAGLGAWWAVNDIGEIIAGVIQAPEEITDVDYDKVEIADCKLVGIIPPAYKIRVEYQRNWNPVSQFFDAVTEAEQQRWKEGGVIAEPFDDGENGAIKTAEPRAIDAPLIRSIVVNEASALGIRDRLQVAWSVARRLYDLTIQASAPDLYSNVGFDYQMVTGFRGRVHSTVKSIGGGRNQVQVWG